MKSITPIKKHLLLKRARLIKFLKSEGYDGSEIGIIFNINRSGVSRILSANEKYKITAKKLLSDVVNKK